MSVCVHAHTHLIQGMLHGSYFIHMLRVPHLHFSMGLVLIILSDHSRRISIQTAHQVGGGLHLLTSYTCVCVCLYPPPPPFSACMPVCAQGLYMDKGKCVLMECNELR
jgi:hypothetical protein